VSVTIYVGIGSNIDRQAAVRAGLIALEQQFGPLALSPLYESVAVGFDGEDFYNMVARFTTHLALPAVVAQLRQIEDAQGRDRSQPRFSARRLDIDLLCYGDQLLDGPDLILPRPEIVEQAFVLRPLADLAPEQRHPRLGGCYRELWQQFRGDRSGLRLAAWQPNAGDLTA